MPGKQRVIAWDTCVFLSWLDGTDPRHMPGIDECVRKIDRGEVYLITSHVTQMEVLPSKLTIEQQEIFNAVFRHPRTEMKYPDLRITALVQRIRDYYVRAKQVDGLDTIGVPDAEQLATAIVYRADAFYTYDEGKKAGKKARGLLSLNGNVAGYPLVVCVPPVTEAFQMPLTLYGDVPDDARG